MSDDAALLRAVGVVGALPVVAVAAIGGLFGGGGARAAAAAPPPPPPQPMPDLLDPAVLQARRRQLEMAAGRSGRASTILSDKTDDYAGTKLGTP